MLLKLFTRIVWKKSSILIPVVFSCPKNPKLYIADTWLKRALFLGTTGVRYRQVWLYIKSLRNAVKFEKKSKYLS